MYRVYQKSVEQTELLRDLRESVEGENTELINSQTKKIHLSPSGNIKEIKCHPWTLSQKYSYCKKIFSVK